MVSGCPGQPARVPRTPCRGPLPVARPRRAFPLPVVETLIPAARAVEPTDMVNVPDTHRQSVTPGFRIRRMLLACAAALTAGSVLASARAAQASAAQRCHRAAFTGRVRPAQPSRCPAQLRRAPGPRGQQGPRGRLGERGATGFDGLPGLAGPQGLQGLIGPAGLAGAAGLTGVPGAEGAAGPAAAKGLPHRQAPKAPQACPAGRHPGDGRPGGSEGAFGAQGISVPEGLKEQPEKQGRRGPPARKDHQALRRTPSSTPSCQATTLRLSERGCPWNFPETDRLPK